MSNRQAQNLNRLESKRVPIKGAERADFIGPGNAGTLYDTELPKIIGDIQDLLAMLIQAVRMGVPTVRANVTGPSVIEAGMSSDYYFTFAGRKVPALRWALAIGTATADIHYNLDGPAGVASPPVTDFAQFLIQDSPITMISLFNNTEESVLVADVMAHANPSAQQLTALGEPYLFQIFGWTNPEFNNWHGSI